MTLANKQLPEQLSANDSVQNFAQLHANRMRVDAEDITAQLQQSDADLLRITAAATSSENTANATGQENLRIKRGAKEMVETFNTEEAQMTVLRRSLEEEAAVANRDFN